MIPCYRSAETLDGVIREIRDTMETMPEYEWEGILVNDCSPDHTFQVIKQLCKENANLTGLDLARNFGQHSALMAGFHYASGEIIVCLDDDGQTPANEVGKLLAEIEEGADVVYARYSHKHHSGFRNWGSHVNELMTRIMLGKPKELFVSSYFAAKRFVIHEMMKYEYPYPYVIGLVLRTTKNIVNVDVNHRDRQAGTSGYTLSKLLNLWFNGFTAFSVKPLRIATAVGACCAFMGFAYGLYTIIKKIFINPPGLITGFSAIVSLMVFIGGMLMLMLGLIGEYMGRMYISVNRSPQYVLRETTGTGENEKTKQEAVKREAAGNERDESVGENR